LYVVLENVERGQAAAPSNHLHDRISSYFVVGHIQVSHSTLRKDASYGSEILSIQPAAADIHCD
jgi:hypothetical protein